MQRTLIVLTAIAAAAACGSSSGGDHGKAGEALDLSRVPAANNADFADAPLDGPSVGARNITAPDVVFHLNPHYDGFAGTTADVLIQSTPNTCTDATSDVFHVDEVQLAFTLRDINNNGGIGSSTYVYPAATNTAFQVQSATYGRVSAPCYIDVVKMTAATVTVSAVNAGAITGSYNITFASGTVTGSFNTTTSCPAISLPSTVAPSCK